MAVNRTKVLEAAQKFLAKNQYDKAIAEYQKLVAEDPRDVRTLLKIGDLHTRRNKPKDAIEVYLKVADLYAKQGFFLKAVAVYKQILKLEPTHLESSLRLAKMYEELGLTSDALTTYESVADAYAEQGAMPRALETMERMVALEGNNIAVRIKYAEALSRASRPQEAATAFAAGARLLKEQGRMDDFLRVVERQLYHDPENVSIARELSSLYLERTDPKRALTKLQICFKADPRDVQTLEMLAEAFRQLGQLPKTISVLKEIARLHGELGATEPRRRTLLRVLELDPNDAEVRLAVTSLPQSTATGQVQMPTPQVKPDQAELPSVQKTTVADEDDLEDVELEIDGAEGDDDDLEFVDEEDEEEVLLIDDDDDDDDEAASAEFPSPEHLLEQADMLEAEERYDDAERLVRQILERLPDHEEAHERLKDLYLATDRRVDAVRELLWLSQALAEHNRPRAIQHARAAHDLAPHSDATQAQLEALGVSADSAAPSGSSAASIDDELAAFLEGPPANPARMSSRPPVIEAFNAGREASFSSAPPAYSSAPPAYSSAPPAYSSAPPAYSSRPPQGNLERSTVPDADDPADANPTLDLLEIELMPSEFGAPPVRINDIDPALFALLEAPLSPEEFEVSLPSEAVLKDDAAIADALGAGPSQADKDFDPLLDAPISPDEFDAPPPQRSEVTASLDNARELLEHPLTVDDFGLTDERFYDSGLMEVEGPPPASRAPRSEAPDEDLFETAPPPGFKDSPEAGSLFDSGGPFAGDSLNEVTLPPEPPTPTMRPGSNEQDVEPPGEDDFATAPPAARGSHEPEELEADAEELEDATEIEDATGFGLTDSLDLPDEGLLPGADPTVPSAPIPELLAESREQNLASIAGEPEPLWDEPENAEAAVVGEEPSLAEQPISEPDTLEAEELSAAGDGDAAADAPYAEETSYAEEPQPTEEPQRAFESAAVAPEVPSEVIPPEVEEVLDEADFFASQGMMDEALEVVQEAILIYPSSLALRTRLLQYEAEADAQEESSEQAADADDSFDIAEQLANELAEVPVGAGDEMVDVESVFAQFKKGVAAQIAPEDSDTHFDLGIAYKEMGLTDDAIAEFELASKSAKRSCTSLTMIGMCYLEKGHSQAAVGYFEQALETPSKSSLEEMALHYELGNARELLGELDLALSEFERVAAQDRTFRGVLNRLDSLRKRGAVA